MKALVEKIIQEKIPCYFVSSHLDDAILSCGGLIPHLADKTSVSVLTIFTEADNSSHTLSARAFLRQCGVPDAKELFEKRREEDKKVLDMLGVSLEHFGFVDALWRKKKVGGILKFVGKLFPELIHVYPTYRFQITSGKVSKADNELILAVKEKIWQMIGGKDQAIVFFPVGLGGHVDHVLTHEVGLHFSQDVVFYSDFPYCLSDRSGEGSLEKQDFKRAEFEAYLTHKNTLIKMYATQPLFSGEPPIIPERYFIPKNLLTKL